MTAALTVVAVSALIASVTVAGIALELVNARSMLANVGLTLVPIWNSECSVTGLPTMHCSGWEVAAHSSYLCKLSRTPAVNTTTQF